MNAKFPKRLGKAPLIDAVFECRFEARFPASNILPGAFLSAFEGDHQLERLPHSDIPELIRNGDANLQYAPLVRLRVNDFTFLIGDRNVAITCNLPYKGWGCFKPNIVKTIGTLKSAGFINKIERYSTKYVNLIQPNSAGDRLSMANISVRIGSHTLANEPCHVRAEMKVGGFINIVQIVSSASATMPDNTSLEGLVIDVDTIKNTGGVSFEEIEECLDDALDNIHGVTKATFFDCLTEDTIDRLEPEYD